MKVMGIDEGSRGAITPGSNGEGGQDVKGDKSVSRFRAVAARGNLLATASAADPYGMLRMKDSLQVLYGTILLHFEMQKS